MNSKKGIIISLASIVIATGLVLLFSSKNKTRRRLTQISDEGYETAHDVLFPLKFNRKYKWTKEGNEA